MKYFMKCDVSLVSPNNSLESDRFSATRFTPKRRLKLGVSDILRG